MVKRIQKGQGSGASLWHGGAEILYKIKTFEENGRQKI